MAASRAWSWGIVDPVCRYGMTVGMSPAASIMVSTLRDVPHAGLWWMTTGGNSRSSWSQGWNTGSRAASAEGDEEDGHGQEHTHPQVETPADPDTFLSQLRVKVHGDLA